MTACGIHSYPLFWMGKQAWGGSVPGPTSEWVSGKAGAHGRPACLRGPKLSHRERLLHHQLKYSQVLGEPSASKALGAGLGLRGSNTTLSPVLSCPSNTAPSWHVDIPPAGEDCVTPIPAPAPPAEVAVASGSRGYTVPATQWGLNRVLEGG